MRKNKQLSLFQGSSNVTERKEINFFGICQTRLLQRKFQQYIKSVYLCDVFCGDGENVINGEIISGSPIKMAEAIKSSGIYEMKEVSLICSDIRKDAVCKLNRFFDKSQNQFKTAIYQKSASEQLKYIYNKAKEERSSHFIITVDPNGPKTLPFTEIRRLSSDPLLSNRIDFIINISATSIKRMINHRRSAGAHYSWWISEVNSIKNDLILEIAKYYKGAWIRKPLGDNQQWLMIAYWNWCPPNNDWSKQGFVNLNSNEGAKALITYEGKTKWS